MTPEELKSRTADLFHEALMRAPDRQSVFLAEACGGNEELFRKVKQLLVAYRGITTSGASPASASSTPSPDMLLALSERYDDIEFIGQGGMGLVFRARDREINKIVALKMLHPALAHDERAIERFRNEIRLALDITHKNVCRTYGLDRLDGTILISMEYVEGETLRSVLNRVKGVSVRQGLAWSLEICEALAAAHDKKIIHRDLKPENIMIDHAGHVRVMDFGIARSLEAGETSAAGTIIGTPHYMSPEQAIGKAVGPASDIYSLGLILYELFTGTRRDRPIPASAVNPHLPHNVSQAVAKCLAENPDERFPTAAELGAALASSGPAKYSLSKLALWAAFSMFGLLLALAVILKYRKPSARTPATIPSAASLSRPSPRLSAAEVEQRRSAAKSLANPPNVVETAGRGEPAKNAVTGVSRPRVRIDLTGAWSGSFTDAIAPAVLQFNLVQSGSEVSGNYTTSLGGGGTIEGNAKNGLLTFTLTQSIQGCPGIFTGRAKVSADQGKGVYSGRDCQGDHRNGSFTMTKGVQVLSERAQLRQNVGGYLRSKFLTWTVEDAQIVMGTPVAAKTASDEAQNPLDIYTFSDPTAQSRRIELAFDTTTKRLREAYLYPKATLTWEQCRQQWGDKFETVANADGTESRIYRNVRIRVRVRAEGNVVRLDLY